MALFSSFSIPDTDNLLLVKPQSGWFIVSAVPRVATRW